MKKVQNFRWHARAGQGAVTASKSLADIAITEGRYSQAFAEYGAEKRGAPVLAFNRFSNEPIRFYCPIEEPDWIICMDPTLIGPVDIAKGTTSGSTFVVNAYEGADWLRSKIDVGDRNIYLLNATRIAGEEIGRDIPNSVVIGAIVKVADLFEKDSFESIFEKRMREGFPAKIAEANIRCFQRGYEEVIKG